MRVQWKQTIELVAGSGLSALFTLLFLIFAGRRLGPAEYANFAAALSVIYFAGVALGPVSPTVSRFTALFHARGDSGKVLSLRQQMNYILGTYGLIVLVLSLCAVPFLRRILKMNALLPLMFSLVIVFVFMLLTVDRAVLQGAHRFREYNVNSVLESALRLALGAAFIIWWPVAASGLMAYLVALLLAMLSLRVVLAPSLGGRGHEQADLGEVARFMKPMILLAIALAAYQNVDMLLVKSWFSAPAAGSYGAAVALAKSVSVLLVPFYVLSLPVLTSALEQGRPIYGITVRLCASFLLLASVPIILFAVVPERIVSILYGRDYVDAAALLVPLGLALVIGYSSLLLAQALAAMNSFRFLYVYCGGVVVQLFVLWARHSTPAEVAWALVFVQTGVLLSMILFFAGSVRGESGPIVEG